MEGTNSLTCRMYEAKYPEVDDVIMVRVKSITEMGAYVSLLEYNDIEGMVLLSELSRRRIRSVNKLIRVNRMEVVTILRVDKEKGYIDLSKRRIQGDDVDKMEIKWNKSKAVHSIMRHVAKRTDSDLEELYRMFGWPMYKKFGHAYDGFKIAVTEPEVLDEFHIPDEIKAVLIDNVSRRLAPQPVKVRADIEITCFEKAGIDAIKEALQAGQAVAEENEFEVAINLVAPPLYVITSTCMEAEEGVALLTSVCDKIGSVITSQGGKLNIKTAARAVTERDENTLSSLMARLELENTEVDGDEPGEE